MFTAAAVAAAIGVDEMHVAGRCEALARRHQFVQSHGMTEWPDGTVTTRYGFTHALHQEVLYDRIPAGRRVHLHRHIGTRQETAYGMQAREIAAELAGHVVHGRDAWRAIPYLRYAGETALRRSAHQEAITHLTMGLELLARLPETPERAQHELALRLALGTAYINQRARRRRSGTDLLPGAGTLSSGWGDVTALHHPAWPVAVLYRAGG